MSNLKISFPDIPFRAKYFTSDLPSYSEDSIYNMVTGPRSITHAISTISTSNSTLTFDMGAGNESTADHLIIANTDGFFGPGLEIDSLTVQRSATNSGYTSEIVQTTFTALTFGVRSNDLVITFPLTSAYRWWQIVRDPKTSAGGSDWRHSKTYLGTFWDPDIDVHSYSPNIEPGRVGEFISDAGNLYKTRLSEPRYRYQFTWKNVSNAKRTEFFNNVVRYKNKNPIFLYTSAQHHLLDDKRVLHCWLLSASQESQGFDKNIITIEVMEDI